MVVKINYYYVSDLNYDAYDNTDGVLEPIDCSVTKSTHGSQPFTTLREISISHYPVAWRGLAVGTYRSGNFDNLGNLCSSSPE